MRFLKYILLTLLFLGITGLVAGGAVFVMIWNEFSEGLPDHTKLQNYEPPITTRVYAWNGSLVGEFAREKRVFVPIDDIPDMIKHAFLAAEDRNFYQHKGIDFLGVLRAVIVNLQNTGSSRRLVGASTITQQVAKNFLLTNEVSFERKIKEAILAFRLEQTFSKDHLLELYMNQIYLGGGAYGVAAAAQHYYGKSLDEITVSEAAYLAALPKAPNNYHPTRHEKAAMARRDWVLSRMQEDGYLTGKETREAKKMPLGVVESELTAHIEAPYFLEDVRRQLIAQYGEDALYKGGLVVRTTLDPKLQDMAARALRKGLVAYDRRRTGYRGAVTALVNLDDWKNELALVERPEGMAPEWQLAAILSTKGGIKLGLPDGTYKTLSSLDRDWGGNALKSGAVIMVEHITSKDEEGEDVSSYRLRQIPKIQGAIVALDPHTGRVLAMEGGWDYSMSEFNRASQALRQTGSAFKPIVFTAGLLKGLSPSTLVNDAPVEFYAGPGQGMWRPKNYNDDYLGPIPLRVGLEKSRNMATIRIAQHAGMPSVSELAKTFGVKEDLAAHLANSLGSAETTLLNLTSGYAVYANGGRRAIPALIDRIQDRRGKTVFRHDQRACSHCGDRIAWNPLNTVPELPQTGSEVVSPGIAYQMVEMMEGVVQRGTGMRLKELGVPLAGKTGTTNESRDTWFLGFSPDLVAGVFVGYDEPKSLGEKETGASVALPIFQSFMEEALKDQKPVPFRIPPDVRLIKVNAHTGRRTTADDENAIWEPFTGDTDPETTMYLLMSGAPTTYAPGTPADINAPLSPMAPIMDGPGYEAGTEEVAPPQPITSGTGGLY